MAKSIKTSHIFKMYWRYAWRYPQFVIGLLISLPISILLQDFLPQLIIAGVVSKLAGGHFVQGQIWQSFGSTLLLFAGLLIIGASGWRVIDAFMWRLEGRVTRDIANDTYRHILSQSATFHANTFGGGLVSQTNKFIGSYIRIADTLVYQVLNLVSVVTFTTIVLWSRTPMYVICLLIFSVIYIASSFFVTRKVRHLGAVHARAQSTQTGYLADSISNVMAIKSFATLNDEVHKFKIKHSNVSYSRLLDLMRANQRQMTYYGLFNRVIETTALVIAIASVVVYKKDIGVAFLIFSYTNIMLSQLWTFGNNSLRNMNRSIGDAIEMAEILETEPDIKDPDMPEPVRIRNGAVELKDVTFTHDGANGPLFKKLNLQIPAGQKVGLVGHSGSGKTSLTRIMLRFSDIDSGEILIDGQNIAAITQDDLRSNIAYVPQEPLLFHRSLTDNISYGKIDATEADVLKASKMAHADEFIKNLPLGYDTLVGERGVKLSGGQRQRVAIARAMIKDSPVLLLDEATSALDSESEKLIQAALWKLMQGRTAVVIAHRLSTIQKMDRIIVMHDGKIVEEGSHAELIKKNGKYAELWAHQSGGFIED